MKQSNQYLKKVTHLLALVEENNRYEIEETAKLMNECINRKNEIYFFGSGHSYYIGQEVFARAGGYAGFIPILENELSMNHAYKSTLIERSTSYAQVILSLYDFKAGDMIVISSNSGRNQLTIELALQLEKKGVLIVALTSMEHSEKINSRHQSGKKLYDLADIVLDNGAPYGDATMKHKENIATGPVSTITSVFLINAVVSSLTQKRLDRHEPVFVFRSSNMDGADEHNEKLFKYIVR